MGRKTDETPANEDPFVGRERELGELRAALPLADRPGRLMLITGDPGIGKTSLAEEVARVASGLGIRAHWGRCREGGGVPTFWPWIQISRSLLAGGARASGANGGEAEALARLAPELVAGDDPGLPATRRLTDSESERFHFFDGYTSFLRTAAPVMLVLDDLHAADDGSLLLLDFVARQLPEMPVLILGTYREPEARADPARAAILATLGRHGKHLPLGGLARAEVESLVARLLPSPPDAQLVTAIHRLTEGNPYFVDEVTRLLAARSGEANRSPGSGGLAVPATVREVVRERLRLLSTDCHGVLEVAAVLGRESDVDLLAAVAEIDPVRLLDLWEEAAAVGVVQPTGGNRVAFAHALGCETLYGDLAPSRRVALHRLAGEALERRHAGEIELHLADLAHHFSRGASPKAAPYAERAAERALALLAYEDAARLYGLALELPAPEPANAAARERRVRLLLGLGHAQVRAGDTPGARASFDRATEAARALGADVLFAHAALGCGGVELGVPSGSVDASLVALLEEALVRNTGSGPELRARLLARLALELYFSDAATRRRALMEEAWALADGVGGATRAYVMHARLVGLWDLTAPAQRLAWSDELVSLATELGDTELTLRAHSYRLLDLIDAGDSEKWEAELRTLERLAERSREPRFLGLITGTRAMRSLWLGRFDEVESLGQKAMELAQPVRDAQTAISVTLQTYTMRRLQARLDEVEAVARASVERFPDVPGARCMLALLHCDRGRPDDARAELAHLGGTAFERIRSQNRLAGLLPWLAEAVVLLGDSARAEVLYRDLEPLAGRNISLQGRVCFGPASYYLGILAGLLGRPEAARQHLDEALAEAGRMQGQPMTASILLEAGRLRLAAGETDEARALLSEAEKLARDLGLDAVTARLDALGLAAESAPATESRPPLPATLRRDGRLWTVGTEDRVLRCKDGKGIRYVAHLVRNAGKALHVLELVALEEGGHADPVAALSPAQLERLGMHVGRSGSGEPVADAQAVRQYRMRLEELREELEEAEGNNDAGRTSRLRQELEILAQSLAAATGLGGRLRPTGSDSERARLNVTRAIRTVVARITEGHPQLGRHLAKSIHTGSFCRYAPDASERVRWTL